MALRTRVWSAGKLVLLGGALLATYVLFAAASMRVALRAREVQVPDFTNRTANEATALAANLGLGLKVDDSRRPDPKIGAGRVLAQEPAAGSVARRQRSVKVWLSAGQRGGHGPAAHRRNGTDRAIASRPGWLDPVRRVRNSIADLCAGHHRRADAAGEEPGRPRRAADQPRRARRQLRDAGSHRRQRRRAAEILRNRGFRVAVVGSNPYPGVAAGIVIRQSPQAGFQIGPGEPISLEVSR